MRAVTSATSSSCMPRRSIPASSSNWCITASRRPCSLTKWRYTVRSLTPAFSATARMVSPCQSRTEEPCRSSEPAAMMRVRVSAARCRRRVLSYERRPAADAVGCTLCVVDVAVMDSSLRLLREDRERLPASHGRGRGERGVLHVDVPGGETGQDLLERDDPFHPGQRGAHAQMDAVAEGEMPAVVAVDVEAVAIREATIVPVRRAQEEEHHAARRNFGAVDDQVLFGDAAPYVGCRRFVAQDLF